MSHKTTKNAQYASYLLIKEKKEEMLNWIKIL